MRIPVTVLCLVALVLAVVFTLYYTLALSALDVLEDPMVSAVRIMERDLLAAQALKQAPAWERFGYRIVGQDPLGIMEDAARSYLRVAANFADRTPYHRMDDRVAVLARAAVIYAELGRTNQAMGVLDDLPASAGAPACAGAVRLAYGLESDSGMIDAAWEEAFYPPAIAQEQPGWTVERVRLRLAERAGTTGEAELTGQDLHARGASLLRRARVPILGYTAFLAGGLVVLLLVGVGAIPSPAPAGGIAAGPWSLRYGVEVMLRCSACALVLGCAMIGPFGYWASLLMNLPMLWFMRRWLFRPDGTTLTAAFGMRRWVRQSARLAAWTVALIAVDQLGCAVIEALSGWLGPGYPFEEMIDERIVFGHPVTAGLVAIDGVIWAPIVEEIAFRGLLYTTLRIRLRPWPAAWLSAALFASAHLYSMAGFLEILWTGLVLALAYERCRSLLPCIAAHALNNLFYVLALLAFYR